MIDRNVLAIDAPGEIRRLEGTIRKLVFGELHRRGAVLGLSGGVDSSVVAALCARALGKDNVLGLFMPDRDSSSEALQLGRLVAERLGIEGLLEPIEGVAAAAGCYERQAEAIRSAVPEYGAGWRCKLTLPADGERLNISLLEVESPQGERRTVRLPAAGYLGLVAATNYKQRLRKMVEYYHADRLGWAVAGTPNRLEYDQGFFVKQGDGAADFKPIAHLYKTQVYALAEALGVPDDVRSRPPTTDTFSLPQTQEEFYFSLPYDRMDLCLWAADHGVDAAEVAPAVDLPPRDVERVFRDIAAKRRAARYLHASPLLAEPT